MIDLKEQGNALYKDGDYLKAAAAYSKAIKQDPNNHVLFSNRSAALLKLNKLAKALADAEECVKLDPSWDKAWMRKGMVLESQGQLQQALECFQKANEAAGGNADYTARIKVLKQKTSSQQKVAKTSKSSAEQAALQYAEAKLAYARERIAETDSKFAPELHFLHPCADSSSKSSSSKGSSTADHDAADAGPSPASHPGMRELSVRAEHAFDAPDVLTMFVGEMRKQAEELQATAVTLVAPKSAVSFPQTWRQQSWQYGAHDGVFVQVQALVPSPCKDDTAEDSDKSARGSSDGSGSAKEGSKPSSTRSSGSSKVLSKTWFIRLRPDKPPSEPIEVSEEFALLPPLLR